MATKHPSSALPAPALSAAYPMANPGYGKRSAPHQLPRTREDFSLLPTRERYVAGFVDHLPEGASMSVKQLAKQLPLYGQQAISTALTALSVAGHLRRVRCSVTSASDETRWVFRTFWSRTARDSEWWNAYLATENNSPDEAPAPEEPDAEPAPEATGVPQQPTPAQAPDTAPAQPRTAEPGPAYLALARLGRNDHRLALSADDCTALEPLATQWLDRGVNIDYLTSALAAGLPAQVDSPLGFLRRRLTDKMPPRLPTAENPSPGTPAPTRRILMECTDCGRPGQPEALPDGLCRPCRTAHRPDTPPAEATEAADVRARMTNLRDLLKTV
ncbi:MarR family transcriptional regulator [Streptomyces sp. 43Y-GA-1]|uniref:MarR family transcriptional regulator n=1 Tax=Streptomyces sp. 43Y-GA-1 TaxID=2939435 RepID=UPI0020BDE378|nr:MarR family transcriptional regulator [Streptomyces sp. 43Y-GA-1]MCL6291339.1 MarR family transcriptional regulator [Streptomyces sp. 43Y-GA-1]